MKKGLNPSRIVITVVLVVVLCLGITGGALAASPETVKLIFNSSAELANTEVEDVNGTDNVEFEGEDDSGDATEAVEANEVSEPEDAQNEAAEDAALIGTAKISELDAIAAAEKANAGYTFVSNGLENENGTIVYSLSGTKNGTKIVVKVNATDGSIVPEQDGDFEG